MKRKVYSTMGYKVRLNRFEGPFDLLVYLIETSRMDIYDIRVAEITEQYLKYIEEMERNDINVATEFIVLAATLIEIKSKMLIPRKAIEESLVEEDPRSELVERLIEYKRIKKIATLFRECEEEGLRVFEKPKEDISEYEKNPEEPLEIDLEQFVSAFKKFLIKKKKIEEIRNRYSVIERQKISAQQKISYISGYFKRIGKDAVTFNELIEEDFNRYNVAVTFSTILEMEKQRALDLEQEYNFGEIIVRSRQ